MKKSVGFIGWRGMVGSVLLERMIKKRDFGNISPVFFSTSQSGSIFPIDISKRKIFLKDAYDIDHLYSLDIIVTCQGTQYTQDIYFKLKKNGWTGFWIDASSIFRNHSDSMIVLDPVNKKHILEGLNKGIKKFIGGNCTVSLMLMALGGLFKKKLINWVSVTTYQAISGAGAKQIAEFLDQVNFVLKKISIHHTILKYPVLKLEKIIQKSVQNKDFPKNFLKVPLFGNIIPWIDSISENGLSKEEWKGSIETNKILNTKKFIPVESTCVRVPSFRCHSQSFFIKLNSNVSIPELESIITSHNKWVRIIKNTPEDSTKYLTPIAVSGTLNISIGRIRKLSIGKKFISIFSVGDQLLWGAAEPIRRMLKILISEI